MNAREIVIEQINHRETRPVPYTLGFEGDVAERLDKHYGSSEWRSRLQNVFTGTAVVDNLKMMVALLRRQLHGPLQTTLPIFLLEVQRR